MSESLNSACVNSLGRPQFELGSAHGKFGVWTENLTYVLYSTGVTDELAIFYAIFLLLYYKVLDFLYSTGVTDELAIFYAIFLLLYYKVLDFTRVWIKHVAIIHYCLIP